MRVYRLDKGLTWFFTDKFSCSGGPHIFDKSSITLLKIRIESNDHKPLLVDLFNQTINCL